MTIGHDLEHGRLRLVVSARDGFLDSGTDFVEGDSFDLGPGHVVTLGAGGEAFFRESGRAG